MMNGITKQESVTVELVYDGVKREEHTATFSSLAKAFSYADELEAAMFPATNFRILVNGAQLALLTDRIVGAL